GVVATLVSPGYVSLGMPTRTRTSLGCSGCGRVANVRVCAESGVSGLRAKGDRRHESKDAATSPSRGISRVVCVIAGCGAAPREAPWGGGKLSFAALRTKGRSLL